MTKSNKLETVPFNNQSIKLLIDSKIIKTFGIPKNHNLVNWKKSNQVKISKINLNMFKNM